MAPSWYWVLDLIGGALALVVIPIVYLAGPGRPSNRLLCAVLFLDAMIWLGIGASAITSGRAAAGIDRVLEVSIWTVPWLYVLFISRAVEHPWTRPLRTDVGTAALAVLGVTAFIMGLLSDGGVLRTWIINTTNAGASVFALIVAGWTWRTRMPGTAERRAWGLFTLAFAARDVGWLIINPIVAVLETRLPPDEVLAWSETLWFGPWLVFVTALTVGIVTGTIPELRASVRVGAGRSIGIAFVAASFIVVTETLESLVGVDGPVAGMLVAVGLVILMSPVQRLAERAVKRVWRFESSA